MSSFPNPNTPYPPPPYPPTLGRPGQFAGAALVVVVVLIVMLLLWRNQGAFAWCCRVFYAGNDEIKVSWGRRFLKEAGDELARQDAAIEALEQVGDEDGRRLEAARELFDAHDKMFPGGGQNWLPPKATTQIAIERAYLAKTKSAESDVCDAREKHILELRTARMETALRVAEMRLELARYEQELDRERLSASDNPVNAARTFFKLGK